MTTHVFKFDDWFMNRNEDWDADFYYLIITDDDHRIHLMNAGSPFLEDVMRKDHPDRIEHDCNLSRHRGHLECSAETDKLKQEYPKIWERLNSWCSFKDRRICSSSSASQ